MVDKVICGNCGEELEVKEGRNFVFCSACGHKNVIGGGTPLNSNNNEQVESEIDKQIALKKLEIESKNAGFKMLGNILLGVVLLLGIAGGAILLNTNTEGGSYAGSMILLFCMVGGIFMIAMPFIKKEQEKANKKITDNIVDIDESLKSIGKIFKKDTNELNTNKDMSFEIVINDYMFDFVGLNYKDVVKIYKNAGFTNIDTLTVNDLTYERKRYAKTVESIKINGNDIILGASYNSESRVIIRYHIYK